MWTTEYRKRHDWRQLRHPSDLTDAEWSLIEPLIPPAKRGGRKREVNVREVVNGVMYVLSTACGRSRRIAAGKHGVRLYGVGTAGGVHPSRALRQMPRASRT